MHGLSTYLQTIWLLPLLECVRESTVGMLQVSATVLAVHSASLELILSTLLTSTMQVKRLYFLVSRHNKVSK